MTIVRAGGGDDEGEELARLLREAATGDPAAHGEVAERYRDKVTGWARAVVKDQAHAEDVEPGVLSSLVRRLKSFRGESRFTTWLFRVTRNAALDRKRIEARRAAIHLEPADAGPAEDTSGSELVALVRSYDHDLTPREREVFRLVDLEGGETSAVAQRLGIAPSTARVLLARARATIRKVMLERHRDEVREAGYDL